jgi:DNA (cytosine-5)-methyltransferase 1
MTFQGLFIDGFAGGGGASTGIAQAIGRNVDIAVNHSETAIAIHKANHPDTIHYCQDIRALWPRVATRGRAVAGAWFSPDCKEFSKAKGGPVKDRSIRALCWEVIVWLEETQPLVGYLENVEEFEYAAPLDGDGLPIKGAEGSEFRRFVSAIKRRGYRVQWRILKACDFGAPTTRKRLYMVMRRDGLPIVWPKPTHAAPTDKRVRLGELLPFRTAAECIDWSIDCPSIFARKKDLAGATKRRIAHGVMRYVVNAARPFIVPVTHGRGWSRSHDSGEPMRTITTAHGGELAAVDVGLAPHITKFHGNAIGSAAGRPMPTVTANGEPARPAGATPLGLVGGTMVQIGYGERDGQAPRALDIGKPLGTMVAGGNKHAQVSAFLSSFYTSNTNGGRGDPAKPLKTALAGDNHHAVVAAHIEQANTGMVGHAAPKPLSTIVGKGSTQRLVETTLIEEGALPPDMLKRAVKVAAFLVKYYGTDGDGETAQIQPVDRSLDAITTKARFAVVTVTIDAVTYVIVDIGLRMLKPRELARAQGFPDNYQFDPECWYVTTSGKRKFGRLPVHEQIRAIGNSVCPPVARALVTANQPGLGEASMDACAAGLRAGLHLPDSIEDAADA